MTIELNDDTNLFGDAIAAAPDVDRDTLSRALFAQLKNITLEQFVTMLTNPFEAVVDYANLCIGEKTGQRISLNFNPHRLDTGTKRFPISLFKALHDPAFVNGLARVVLLNKKKGNTKDLLYASIGMGVQGTSYVQEFPPHVARDLALQYGMSKSCRVLDPCAGWGGRMLGFSAVVNSYTCCEPSARTAAGLRKILEFIRSFRADFMAEIYEAPFEDEAGMLLPQTFDFAMTSPPYYDTEHYAPGEVINSMNRYGSFTEWAQGFYAPLIHSTMRALKPGACFMLNIGSRIYPLNDKLIEISEGKYEVSKDKARLSASNGLGKKGEGETFYEVKNPGQWVEPAALPVVVHVPDSAVSFAEAMRIAAETLSTFGAVDAINELSDNVDTSQSAAAAVTADEPDDFNPLDAFLSDFGPEPLKSSPELSDDADNVSQIETQPQAVAALPTELTTHEVEALMLAHGHQLFARGDKLVITNSSALSDADRELLKKHKQSLLIIIPTYVEETKAPESMLVQFLGEAPSVNNKPKDWKLEAPPSLSGIDEVEIDFETDGLDWWNRDIAIGWSLRLPNGAKQYYPIRHQGSENLDVDRMREWWRTEVRNKRITNANTRFDVHVARALGVDLVEQHCEFSDVMHYAALLDDHRKKFNLNQLALDFLGREKEGMDLDPTRMASYEPWIVAKRALGDVETVAELKAVMYQQLDAQELQRVRELEDGIIPVVCEMEKNGSPLDVELLTQTTKDTEEHYHRLIKEISHEAGFAFDDSDASWTRLFERYKIPLVFNKKKGTTELSDKPTFKDSVLERVDHPVIKTARFAAQLDSLRSKIYKPYSENVDGNGLLRIEYNQLRIDDEKGQRGTVSGRFSAPYVQQVPNHDNHYAVFGHLYDPRRLYIARGLQLFMAADAAQIEYRIFASHAKNKNVLAAYATDPRLSFHKLMWPKITKYRADFSYTNMKSFNFMRIYGGGSVKTALMMGMITEQQADMIEETKQQRTSPLLAKAREIEDIYAREMPEATPLMKKAMHLAMAECNKYCNRGDDMHKTYRHRGYVKTVLGRRSRFPTDYKIHKALNAIIQGSAADIMKTKLVELFKKRKEFGITIRATVHDEVTGDVPDVEASKRIQSLLNEQSIPMAVPILWEAGTGKNWAEAK